MKHIVTVEWNVYPEKGDVYCEKTETYVFNSGKAMKKALLQKWVYGADVTIERADGVLRDFYYYTTESERKKESETNERRRALGMTYLQYYEYSQKRYQEWKARWEKRLASRGIDTHETLRHR